jgi:hypothetical protein
MKYLIGSILKILLYLFIFVVPVSLFVTFFALGRTGLPLWNIGIRNVLAYSRDFIAPSILMSYLVATLFVVALMDKMRVKSLIVLHLPALILACIIGAGLILTRGEQAPFPLSSGSLRVSPAMFLKNRIFVHAGNHKIQLLQGRDRNTILHHYDIENNRLAVIPNLALEREGRNRLFIDEEKREVVIVSRRSLPEGIVRIPYREFPRRQNTTGLRMFRVYGNQIGRVRSAIRNRTGPLGQTDRYIFLGSLYITLLMVSIPLVYGLNDSGWTFSGIIGVFLVLAVLPFFYRYIFWIADRLEPRLAVMGKFSYLVPSIIFGLCGILLDLIVAARERSGG